VSLLNYTTTIAASKTAAEVQAMLAKAGARSVMTEYDSAGSATGVAFTITVPGGVETYSLPVRADRVLTVLQRQKVERRYSTPDHAERVAWRIVKDWLEAQLAIVATEMVSLPQVMLPYMHADATGATVFEVYDRQRQLGPSGGDGHR
jgi:hypothetical protein